MYTFLFDRRSLTWLTLGVLAAAVLLVAIGVVIGLQIDLPEESGRLAAVADDFSAIEKRLEPPPKAAPPPPPATTPPTAAPTPPATTPPPPAVTPPPPPTSPPPSTTAAPRIEEPLPTVTPITASHARHDEPSSPPSPAGAFTVQVAAYSVESNARREVTTLEAKGYRPYVVETRTADGRPLMRVLIGVYESRAKAFEAAARFVERESREAVVRPQAHV